MATASHASFAEVLRRSRQAAGLTQEELAERAGLSARAISDLERGVNRMPFRSTVEQLVQALALPARERTIFELVARGRAVPCLAAVSPGGANPPLVGREPELEELERHLTGTHPSILIVAGEPGIGKTRLLEEAAQRGSALGYTVLHGGCQRRSGHEPYSPVLEALATYIDQQADNRLRPALAGCSWLGRLLPELGETREAPSGPLAAHHERRLMFAAVARFLDNVGGAMGTLLVLDDLQWAGVDLCDLLGFLMTQDQESRLRVVAAYRHTEVDTRHPLFVLLSDLSRAHFVRQLALGPLSDASASALLGAIMAGQEERLVEQEQRIVQRAGGVPFYLVSYAQTFQLSDSPDGDNVPWDITQNLRQRIGALPGTAQEILGLAAVIGRIVPHRLLMETAAQGEEPVLAALDTTSRAGLLVENSRVDHRFVHDIVRDVIEADLGAGRRGVLHRRVGETLERTSGPALEERAAELAWHFLEGDVPGRALPYVLLAGDQAETVFAHEEAERHYRTALAVAQETRATDCEAEAREKLGRTLNTMGRYEDALHMLEGALQMYAAAGNLAGETRAIAVIGRTYARKGTPREGLDRIRPLLARLESQDPSPHLAELYLTLAHLLWDSGSPRETLTVADRALELGRVLHDDWIRAAANYWWELAVWQIGHPEDETRRCDDQREDATLVPHLIRLSRGEVRESKPHLEQELRLARMKGDPSSIAWNLSLLGFCALILSEWSYARVCMEEALEIARALGSSYHIGPLMDMGLLSLFEGDWDAASRYLQAASDLAEQRGDLFAQLITSERLARLDLAQGHPAEAIERLTRLRQRPALRNFRISVLLSTLANAHLQMGDVDRAHMLVADAVRREAWQKNHLDLAYALVVQANVLTRLGQVMEAEQNLERALSLYRSTPSPYFEALTLYDFGLLTARRGEPESAQRQLREACAIFAWLGARKDLEKTEQALAAFGPAGV